MPWSRRGVGAPPVTDLFGQGGRAFLTEVQLRPIPQARLQANLRLIDLVSPEVAAADRELRELFRGDPRTRKLVPIPGIGFTTAALVVAEVWDVSRFPSPITCARGPGSPPPSTPAPNTPGGATSPSRDRGGSGGRWWSPPAARTSRTRRFGGSATRSLDAGGTRSPR